MSKLKEKFRLIALSIHYLDRDFLTVVGSKSEKFSLIIILSREESR